MKKFLINSALIYACIGAASGVFYREFTKFMEYDTVANNTTLGVVHSHYLVLGVIFFLLFLLLDAKFKMFDKENKDKIATGFKHGLICYHVGLNIAGVMMLVRGTLQVLGTELTNGMDAMISGLAGIGHVVLGIAFISALVCIRLRVLKDKKENNPQVEENK